MYRSRRYHKPRPNARRWQIGAVAGAAVVIVGVGLGVASAAQATPTVNCPQVKVNVAVPAEAQAEVVSNLNLLNTQIDEANNRIKTTEGQGGANFVQNAILGPLKDKRFATINRIETAIGRRAPKPDLNAEGLSTCTLNQSGAASQKQSTTVTVRAAGTNAAGTGPAPTVNCPDVKINVAIPAQAQNEVNQNLALLQTQIKEANQRIIDTTGQGGANFIQNAILGPLKDKRFATINRIETAIGRNAPKPDLNAEGLSTCTLNENGGGANTGTDTNAGNTGNTGNNNAGNNNAGNNNGGNGGAAVPGANLGILTNNCSTSKLAPADGFQKPNVCVSTEFGEVGAAANNPSLLITRAPQVVKVNQPFTLTISSRNLIRDRFLAAGAGGYYVESSVLNGGIERGHFHTACRILQSLNSAPAPDPVPAFFVATEDKKGGRGADSVQIQVPGLPQAGTFQCASWSGDGSHRIPMMERANQTPAMDAVRIRVTN
jgi:hypothetical protein